MTKLSSIAELARDSTLEACRVAIESLQRVKPNDDMDGSTKAVLRRMEFAIEQASQEIENNAQQIGEGTDPLSACAITSCGAITGVSSEITRSLIQVKRQRDLLLKVVQTYAKPDNWERGRMFRPATKDENAATGKSQQWDDGKTARDAIGLMKSTWMPCEILPHNVNSAPPTEAEQKIVNDAIGLMAKNPANYDELLAPIDGGILFVPKQVDHEVCTVGGCYCQENKYLSILPHISAVPSKILEY